MVTRAMWNGSEHYVLNITGCGLGCLCAYGQRQCGYYTRMHAVYTTESTLGRRETNTLDTSGFILVRF